MKIGRVAQALVLPLVLLGVWQVAVSKGWLAASQSASPSAVFTTMLALLVNGDFIRAVLTSLSKLGGGVFLGATLGTISGTLVAYVPVARRSVGPLLAFLAGIPVVIWIPFWIMMFGVGQSFHIALVAIATFFLVYSVAFSSTRRASSAYLELLQLYEKSRLYALIKIYLPASAAQSFLALRLSFAFGWIVIFFVEGAVSEMGSEGLGWFISNARAVGRVEQEFAGLLVLGSLALIIDALLSQAQRHVLTWSDAVESRLS